MKTKGITIWEQHLEHFVLAIAVLIFVAFTAMQFIGDPNAVDVAGKKVGPGQVDRLLKDHANEIARKIAPDAPAPAPIGDPTPVLAKFQAAKAAGVSPQPTLLAWSPQISPVRGYVVDNRGGQFVQVTPPAPYALLANQYYDTIQPDAVKDNADLQKVLTTTPYDITWITSAAKFSIGTVRQGFAHDGADGSRALPVKWYGGRVDCIDVKNEREELVDGQWTNHVTLDPIPGQRSFRTHMASRIDATTRDQILGFVADPAGRTEIIEPEFYPCIAGVWAPPGKEAATPKGLSDDEIAILNLKNLIKKLTVERDRIAARLKTKHCPESGPTEPPKTGPNKGSGGGGKTPTDSGGGKSGGGGGGPAPPGSGVGPAGQGSGAGNGMRSGDQGDVDSKECMVLRKQLKEKNDQIAKAQADLEKLAPKDKVDTKADATKPEEPLGDEITIWAHDITIQPGHTYRYRFTVDVYNPLFLHKADLMPAQQPMAEKFVISSQTSDWSAPIRAEPPLRVFVTEARPASQNTGVGALPFGIATAEVYRFYDGRWWKEDFRVYPGDHIGAEKATRSTVADAKDKEKSKSATPINYSTDWFVLDVVEDMAADKQDIDHGRGAVVWLQSLSTEGITEVRSPRDDHDNPDRQFLNQQVKLAGGEGSIAVAKRPGTGD